MQSLILKVVKIFCIFIFFLCPLPIVYAQGGADLDLYSNFESFKSGELSPSDFGDILFSKIEKSPDALSSFIEYKRALKQSDIESFADANSIKILKLIRKGISKGNSELINRFNDLSNLVIPKDWVDERKQIQVLVDTFASLEKVGENRDIDSLLKLDFSSFDKAERKLFEEHSLKIVEQFLEQAYDNENSFEGFKALSGISSAWPTAGAVDKAQELLVEMHESRKLNFSLWSLDAPVAQSLVRELIANDEANRARFLGLYEHKIRHSVKNKSFKSAGIYLNWILGNRPDPDPKNIELRKELVFLSPGSSFSKKQIDKLVAQDSFSFVEKLKSGYYGSSIPVVIISSLLVLFSLIALFLLKSKFKGGFNLKSKSKKSHYSNAVDSEDEYTKLLAIFGLDENASETQIKRAFRNAVKEHHPDAHGAGGVVTDEEGNVDGTFQDLKESYNRILEIRSSWFGN